MRELNWFEPGNPLDAEEIAAAQKKLHVELPSDYVLLIQSHAGASNPDESEFEYYDQGMKKIGNFGTILSLSQFDDESVFGAMDNLSQQLPQRVIPIVDTGSGDCICFDYRTSPNPSIVYFAHEHSSAQALIPLADSFSSFLEKLQEPTEE